MNTPVKLLLLFVNETDVLHARPLYQVIVERLRQLDVAGATAVAGLVGFGHHQRLHHKGLFGVADDRPITIVAIDEESKLRAAVPEVRALVREGLILLLDAELVADVAHS
jgi:PII-like signaling protein